MVIHEKFLFCSFERPAKNVDLKEDSLCIYSNQFFFERGGGAFEKHTRVYLYILKLAYPSPTYRMQNSLKRRSSDDQDQKVGKIQKTYAVKDFTGFILVLHNINDA